MGAVLDANDATEGPNYNGNRLAAIYFIFFIIFCSIFLMGLFTGIIFSSFMEEQGKQKGAVFKMLNKEQINWIVIQDIIKIEKPAFDILTEP